MKKIPTLILPSLPESPTLDPQLRDWAEKITRFLEDLNYKLKQWEVLTEISLHGTTHNPGGSDAVTTAVPVTQAFGDVANEGTATSLARSDHKHGMPAHPKLIKDADADTSVDTEETTDADTIVGKVGGTEVLRFHSSGIIDFSKQSACAGYLSANQTIPSGDANITKINFDTEEFDVQNEFNTTNHRFTALKAGKYLICGQATWWISSAVGIRVRFELRKNGATVKLTENAEPWEYPRQTLAVMLNLAANDYIEFFAGQWSGADKYLQGGAVYTYFSILKVM